MYAQRETKLRSFASTVQLTLRTVYDHHSAWAIRYLFKTSDYPLMDGRLIMMVISFHGCRATRSLYTWQAKAPQMFSPDCRPRMEFNGSFLTKWTPKWGTQNSIDFLLSLLLLLRTDDALIQTQPSCCSLLARLKFRAMKSMQWSNDTIAQSRTIWGINYINHGV